VSTYRVLAAASDGLRRVLWTALSSDPVTRSIIDTDDNIALVNPTETAKDSSRQLSLWLYHVNEDEFCKNREPVRLADGRDQRAPLVLDLFYLLTPFTRSGESDHLVLGRSMQTFHDQANVRIVDSTAGVAINEELRITLFRRSLDEISQVWQALREPYRLSVCYQVRVTHIDSDRFDSTAPVIDVSGLWQQGVDLVDATS
jgi:hypothetical protein